MKKVIAILVIILMLFTLVQGVSRRNVVKANSQPIWPMFHYNAQHTGQCPYDTSKNNGTLKWKYQTEGKIFSSPAISSDGTIYIGSGIGYLYAIGIDIEAPVITIDSPADGSIVNTSSVIVTGKVTDNVGVTAVYLNDIYQLALKPDGTFGMNVLLTLGTNIIKITAFDTAGNKGEKSIRVGLTFDFEPPVITIDSPADGSTVNTSSVTVTGRVVDNIGVVLLLIDTMKIDFAPDGSFSANVSLNEDTNIIKIVAYDGISSKMVGNKTEKNLTITYKEKAFTINTSTNLGGSISPSGTITVNSGESKTFTITPNSGYKISLVKVDGISKGSLSSYTFTNITSDHTISVTFEKEITQTIIVLKIGNTTFTVNGVSNTLDSPPVIKNNRTLLPIRAIIEALNGIVGWDANEKKVTVILGNDTIELWIGKNTAKVNGVNTLIDSTNSKVVPEIINSRTMLPLRFVTENLGCDVQWEGTTKTITITYQGE
jgi:hypothetical protein